jgi:hypothetical protein
MEEIGHNGRRKPIGQEDVRRAKGICNNEGQKKKERKDKRNKTER